MHYEVFDAMGDTIYEGTDSGEAYFYLDSEEGTTMSKTPNCRGCGEVAANERFDAHGVTTGHWCQTCYDSRRYPYRKDVYPTFETHGFGERLNEY